MPVKLTVSDPVPHPPPPTGTKKTTKFDKVVAREVCQITSRGTRTFSAVEGDACEAELNYLLAVREQVRGPAGRRNPLAGVS